MILRTLLLAIVSVFFIQVNTNAQIRTTYDKNINIQGGFTYNMSPDFNKFWNFGNTFAISREREFNSGWYVLGGLRFSSISFSDDDFLVSTGLNQIAGTELTFDNSEVYQVWGAVKYAYPILSPRLTVHGMAGLHVSIYHEGSVSVDTGNFSQFDINGENSGYGGLLFGGGLGFELIPDKLKLFAETQYYLGSTSGTDTIFIGLWPVEFGISF